MRASPRIPTVLYERADYLAIDIRGLRVACGGIVKIYQSALFHSFTVIPDAESILSAFVL